MTSYLSCVHVMCCACVAVSQAHSVCHLLGNEARPGECSEQHQPLSPGVSSPRAAWARGVILKFSCGPHFGKYVIVLQPPFSSGLVRVIFREFGSGSSSSSNEGVNGGETAFSSEPFEAECSSLQLGVPRRKDQALVLAGPLRGHVGRVTAVLGGEAAALDNLPPAGDPVPLRDLAWLHAPAAGAGASSLPPLPEALSILDVVPEGGGVGSSGFTQWGGAEEEEEPGQVAADNDSPSAGACQQCGLAGEALVRCCDCLSMHHARTRSSQ